MLYFLVFPLFCPFVNRNWCKKVSTEINENKQANNKKHSCGHNVYKIAFLYSHNVKWKIAKRKCLFFVWKHVTWLWFASYLYHWETLQFRSRKAMKNLWISSFTLKDCRLDLSLMGKIYSTKRSQNTFVCNIQIPFQH